MRPPNFQDPASWMMIISNQQGGLNPSQICRWYGKRWKPVLSERLCHASMLSLKWICPNSWSHCSTFFPILAHTLGAFLTHPHSYIVDSVYICYWTYPLVIKGGNGKSLVFMEFLYVFMGESIFFNGGLSIAKVFVRRRSPSLPEDLWVAKKHPQMGHSWGYHMWP